MYYAGLVDQQLLQLIFVEIIWDGEKEMCLKQASLKLFSVGEQIWNKWYSALYKFGNTVVRSCMVSDTAQFPAVYSCCVFCFTKKSALPNVLCVFCEYMYKIDK